MEKLVRVRPMLKERSVPPKFSTCWFQDFLLSRILMSHHATSFERHGISSDALMYVWSMLSNKPPCIHVPTRANAPIVCIVFILPSRSKFQLKYNLGVSEIARLDQESFTKITTHQTLKIGVFFFGTFELQRNVFIQQSSRQSCGRPCCPGWRIFVVLQYGWWLFSSAFRVDSHHWCRVGCHKSSQRIRQSVSVIAPAGHGWWSQQPKQKRRFVGLGLEKAFRSSPISDEFRHFYSGGANYQSGHFRTPTSMVLQFLWSTHGCLLQRLSQSSLSRKTSAVWSSKFGVYSPSMYLSFVDWVGVAFLLLLWCHTLHHCFRTHPPCCLDKCLSKQRFTCIACIGFIQCYFFCLSSVRYVSTRGHITRIKFVFLWLST